MATIVAGPVGMVESSLMTKVPDPMTRTQWNKRNELKTMLIAKLVKQHASSGGDEATKRAVIEREVDKSHFLKSGKLGQAELGALEREVAKAVKATQPGPMVSHIKPRADPTKVWTAGEMAESVKAVSNWTAIAEHRAKYYAVEQEAKQRLAEERKMETRRKLAHQMAFEQHQEQAAREIVRKEKEEIDTDLALHHKEEAAAKAKMQAKVAAQKADRDKQMREQAARNSAASRLQKLEVSERATKAASERTHAAWAARTDTTASLTHSLTHITPLHSLHSLHSPLSTGRGAHAASPS